MAPVRVERLLANLGYGTRKECQQLVSKGRALRRGGHRLKVGEKVLHHDVLLDGQELDPPSPIVLMLNKPTGVVVTAPDDPNIPDPKVYDLLPPRFGMRKPFLSSVGRLDKATSGLLLLTDDGLLVHQINSPKSGIWKVYQVTLAAPLVGLAATEAAEAFASGELVLMGDPSPLLPARLDMTSDTTARMCICEGRYHQVRRMFTAIGHEVVALHRASVGGLELDGLPESDYRFLIPSEVQTVFNGPSEDSIFGRS